MKTMEEYKKWLEQQIERCLSDKDLQREHWAFCKAYEKFTALHQPLVSGMLPTDEEIFNEAEGRYPIKTHNNPDNSPYVGTQKTFIHGVRWALAFVQGNYRLSNNAPIGRTCVVPDCKKEAIQGAFHGLCSQHIWPNGQTTTPDRVQIH